MDAVNLEDPRLEEWGRMLNASAAVMFQARTFQAMLSTSSDRHLRLECDIPGPRHLPCEMEGIPSGDALIGAGTRIRINYPILDAQGQVQVPFQIPTEDGVTVLFHGTVTAKDLLAAGLKDLLCLRILVAIEQIDPRVVEVLHNLLQPDTPGD